MKVKIIDFSNWSVGGLNTKLGIDPCTEWYSAREGVSFAIEYNFENSLPLDYGLDYADKLLINWPIKEETRPITRRNLLNRIKRAVEAKLKPLLGDLLTWDKYAYDYSDYVAKNYYQRMYLTWK